MDVAEVAQCLSQRRRDEILHQSHVAVSGDDGAGRRHGLSGEGRDSLGIGKKGFSGLREGHAGRAMVQQRMTYGALQLAALVAKNGLAVAERRSGAADASGPYGAKA